jgi:hypothetical protein
MWILLQKVHNWLNLQLAIQRDIKIHYFHIHRVHFDVYYTSYCPTTVLSFGCHGWLYYLPKTGMPARPTFAKWPSPLTPILFTLSIIPTYYQVSKMCWIALVPWALWGKATGSQFPKFLPSPTHMEQESRHSIQSHHTPVTTYTHTYITHTFNKIWNQSTLHLHAQLSPVQSWHWRVIIVRWAKQYCTSIT